MTTSPPSIKPRNYFCVALQSALAAGLFLGMPAGLLLWLILIRQTSLPVDVEPFVAVLQINGYNKVIVLTICSLGWSYQLGQIARYRAWWKIGPATMLGIILAWISPLSNLDGWFGDRMPIHTLYALTMSGLVASVTLCVGLAYGIILRSFKAAFMMSLTTSVASVLAYLLVIFIFDQFGIRVGGEAPFAMSKVTAVSLLASAITGGAVLGVGFSKFSGEERYSSHEQDGEAI